MGLSILGNIKQILITGQLFVINFPKQDALCLILGHIKTSDINTRKKFALLRFRREIQCHIIISEISKWLLFIHCQMYQALKPTYKASS